MHRPPHELFRPLPRYVPHHPLQFFLGGVEVVEAVEQLGRSPGTLKVPCHADGAALVDHHGHRVDGAGVVVVVAAVGIRRAGDRDDVYALAERLTRLGLL